MHRTMSTAVLPVESCATQTLRGLSSLINCSHRAKRRAVKVYA